MKIFVHYNRSVVRGLKGDLPNTSRHTMMNLKVVSVAVVVDDDDDKGDDGNTENGVVRLE